MSDPRIERILGQSELPPAALADVRTTIDNSPYLQAVTLKAIDEQRVRHFSLSKMSMRWPLRSDDGDDQHQFRLFSHQEQRGSA